MSDNASPPSAAPASTPPASTSSTPTSSPAAPASGVSSAPQAGSNQIQGTNSNSKFADPKGAPPAGETPAEKAERKAREIAYKVKGEQRKVNLDTLSDEELATKLQFADMGRQSMQEAAEVRKAWSNIVDAIKKDPWAALQDPVFGLNLDELAEKRLVERYQEQQMSPEQKERVRLQRELAERDAKLKEYETAKETEIRERIEADVAQRTEAEFTEALDLSGLPKNRHTLSMMADLALVNLDGEIDMTPQQMAAEVKGRAKEIATSLIGSLEGDQLAEFLGADVIKKVLRYSLNKVKPQAAQPVQPKAPAPVSDEDDDRRPGVAKRRDSMMTFKKYLRDR